MSDQGRAREGSGLGLSRRFYDAYGPPIIAEIFGNDRDRVAAGLVGDGSDCFGFDDEISRDHDWGPRFVLWLSAGDFARHGAALQKAYEALPTEFEGYRIRLSPWGTRRNGVWRTDQFYHQYLGIDRAPRSWQEWQRIPEHHLAACTNGEVFVDDLDEFSSVRRKLLSHYPEDIRLKRLAARCMAAGQAGQYNLPRMLSRGDLVAGQQAEARFAEAAIGIVAALNRVYAPYYKWMHAALDRMTIIGPEVKVQLSRMIDPGSSDLLADPFELKLLAVTEVCMLISDRLRREKLSDIEGQFLLEHGINIQSRIGDPDIRSLDVWTE